jgi:MFS family permease
LANTTLGGDTADLTDRYSTVSGTPQRWRVLWATFLTYFFDSFDLMVLAIAMPVLLKVLAITLPEGGLLGSATMLGAMIGSVVFGLIAENYGRRFALVLALCWLGIGMGAVYFIDGWLPWMALRFLTGLAIGGVWGPCAALIADHWAPQYRGRAVSFVFSSFAIGAIVAALVGRWVMAMQWQWLFVAGAASIPVALLVHRLIPPDSQKSPTPSQAIKSGIGLGAIFAGDLARITLPATLISMVNLAGYWGAAFWIPTFLTKERGLSVTTMLGFSFVMYVGMFFGFQFFGLLADKIGRRRSMMTAFIVCAVSIAIYIVVEHPMFLFWWGAVVGFALCGAGGILGAYYAELFPDHLRAYAGGFCWNMGRIGAMIAPFTIGVVGKTNGLQAGLAVTCVIYLVGAVMLFLLPETYQPKEEVAAK